MKDIIIALIVITIVALAVLYIVVQKKKGAKCIGCPHSGSCQNSKKDSSCKCGCNSE